MRSLWFDVVRRGDRNIGMSQESARGVNARLRRDDRTGFLAQFVDCPAGCDAMSCAATRSASRKLSGSDIVGRMRPSRPLLARYR